MAKQALHESFNFKHWSEAKAGAHLEFCGCRLDSIDGGWLLHQKECLQKVKPLTVADDDEERQLNTKEVTVLRGLLGHLQWPATKTSLHLSASVSLLCGEVGSATVSTATQVNKLLKFAKANNNDVGLQFSDLGQLHELCMMALSDAAWGVRRNHEPQGGYFVLLKSVKALQGQLDQPYVVLDWRSYKLPRISRSSRKSEAQACAGAMDALEYLLISWHGCVTPGFELRHLDVEGIFMQSALVVDAKALYDSLKAEVPQMQGDRRSKIEVMVVKQKVDEMKTRLK